MRYPPQSACEVRASIDCAREIRGNTSKESEVTFLPASALMASESLVGDKNEIVSAPDLSCEICSLASGLTVATTSAELMAEALSAIWAPTNLYSSL